MKFSVGEMDCLQKISSNTDNCFCNNCAFCFCSGVRSLTVFVDSFLVFSQSVYISFMRLGIVLIDLISLIILVKKPCFFEELSLMLKAENIEGQKAKLAEKREAVIAVAKKALKGNPAAEYIAEKLLTAGMPVTEATVNKVYQAVEFAGNLSGMSESVQYYMVK